MKMIRRNLSAAVALSLLTLTAVSASAGDTYYRWIDQSGTEVNSDRPPPAGTDYERISSSTSRIRPGGPENAPAAATTQTGTEHKSTHPENTTEPKFEKDPKQCATAMKNLDALNTYARIRVPDENGNYRYINEEEKAAQRATAEAVMKQHCE